jgi:short-subunit dehydrogenase
MFLLRILAPNASGGDTVSQKLIILGATSKIAQEVARLAAAERKELLLVARHREHLSTVAGDLAARGAVAVHRICADLADVSSHETLVSEILAKMPDPDTLLVAYGTLGDQQRAEEAADYALGELNTNFTSPVSLLTRLSSTFAQQGKGCIAVVTSVAGDRPRRSNYVYGAAKGSLSLFLQGLQSKMTENGVRVLTIKPGPVSTPMTAHMRRHRLFAKPESVARIIYREIESGRADVVYVPWYWRWIMFGVRLIPESVAKRMKL